MSADKPLVVLVNPTSGGGRGAKMLAAVERELDERRLPFRVERTRGLSHAVTEALRAVEAGELPVAMGGDGLIGAVGGAIAGAETPLGIIPAGRGNDLARVLGIEPKAEAAVAAIAAGEVRRIDVGEANGERFLGIASAGFDSEANRIANETRLLRGNLVYAYGALRALIGWRPARFTVQAGEERLRFTGYTVAAANSRAYGGGMMMAPDADLSDGSLDVVMVGEVGKLRFLANLPKVFRGTHIAEEQVNVLRAPRIELSASRPFALYADGERLTDLPATIRILPRALGVLAPRAAT